MDISRVDERFQSVFHDQRFQSIKQKQRKVKIDRRFASMFTDDKFKLKYHIDKRGRPLNESSSDNLQKYYRISNKDKRQLKLERKKERDRLKNILNDQKTLNEIVKTKKEETDENSDAKNDLSDSDEYWSSDDESDDEERIDLARGEGNIESSSDEEEDEDIEMLVEGGYEWNELDKDAEITEEVTKRLALCNMDWDRIKAIDLMVLFDGFKPTGGSVRKVAIYPSEFGAKRLAEENQIGPIELQERNEFSEEKEAERFQNEKFREHQINRLKYYYAVIECDSKETAESIYTECDGIEYESSATKLDLRFIPDHMEFNDHAPKDVADSLPDAGQYNPSNFVTTALQQAKVHLTWDETDPNRVRLTTRKFNEENLAEMDIKDFLASSSEEEEENDTELLETNNQKAIRPIGLSSKTTDQDQINRYRSLLLGDLDDDDDDIKEDDVDMEITWEPTLEEIEEDAEEDNIVSDDGGHDDDERKENKERKNSKKKRKRKISEEEEIDPKQKAELEMLMLDAEDTKLKHFDMNEITKEEKMSKKKKRKLGKDKKEDDFKLDMGDARFSAVFTSPEYAVDPNNPAFRKTKAMKQLIEERQERLHGGQKEDVSLPKPEIHPNHNEKSDLNKLVKSIKSKTKKQFTKKKVGKKPSK